MVLEENLFVECLLPQRVMRKRTDTEMEAYHHAFREPGEASRSTFTWPRQLPIEGEPADVVEVVKSNGTLLSASSAARHFVSADPGIISGRLPG